MVLSKQAVKVLVVFAVLFVLGFAFKFLNLNEEFITIPHKIRAKKYRSDNDGLYRERQRFMKDVKQSINFAGIKNKKRRRKLLRKARKEANNVGLTRKFNLNNHASFHML